MRYLVVGAMAGLCLVGSGVASAAPQETKSVRGIVSAVGADSVTVTVKGQEMKFSIDAKTEVVARGGATATRAAQAKGKSGAPIASLLKAGQTVDVRYHEAGMHAASVHVIAAAAAIPAAGSPAVEKPKSATMSGIVSALTGSSLTVKGSTGEATFAIDAKTDVIGTGLGTKAREEAASGKKTVLSDLVGVGDSVVVTYHETGGSKQAAEVRLRKKASK